MEDGDDAHSDIVQGLAVPSMRDKRMHRGIEGEAAEGKFAIRVSCPHCSRRRKICMDELWRRSASGRFFQLWCSSCQIPPTLGTWFVSRRLPRMTVSSWLQRHWHGHRSFYEHLTKPPTATVELFHGVMIKVSCRLCGKKRKICMQRLWLRSKNTKSRFRTLRCKKCMRAHALGVWHIPPRVRNVKLSMTVSSWLRQQSYAGRSFYDHYAMPPTATAKLFYGMDTEGTADIEAEQRQARRRGA